MKIYKTGNEMKLNLLTFIGIMCINLYSVALGLPKDIEVLNKWERIMADSDVIELHKKMKKGLPWINCSSDTGQDTPELRKRKLALFHEFRNKIMLFEIKGRQENLIKSVSRIQILFDLESMIKQAGGYNNKTLSISISRLAAWEITRLVVTQPAQIKNISTVLFVRNNSHEFEPLQTIVSLANEDENLQGNQKKIEKLFLTKKIKESKDLGIYIFYDELRKSLPNELAPSNWLGILGIYNVPNVYKLLGFEARSELVLRSTLPCLINYLEKNGDISKINRFDVSMFNKILGDDRWNHRFPFLQVRKPDPAALYNLIQEGLVEKPTDEFLIKIAMKKQKE
jgi:hypothetical protein